MRKKEEFILLKQSKRNFYCNKYRKQSKGRFIASILTGGAAIFCLLYCLAIAFFISYGTKFFLIWAVLGFFFAGLCFVLKHKEILNKIPKWIQIGFVTICLLGVICFVGVEVMILSKFEAKASSGADYIVVLGAQWKENGPSYVLQKRLDTALKYLQENPETMVIVSGGQGSNEPISEALGMKQYLVAAGIKEEHILMEDTSSNTYENLTNSAQLLNKEKDKVVLVTSDFHMFRASSIAKKQGYLYVEGMAADSYPAMLLNNLLREFFGVGKDFLMGNL